MTADRWMDRDRDSFDSRAPATRRGWLAGAGAVAASLLLSAPARGGEAKPAAGGEHKEKKEEISPPEDLMREHGVLDRILLIYEEAIRRIDAGEPAPAAPLRDAASIVRSFIEDYHETLEEEHLFPRFEKAGRLVDLVGVLRDQHRAGRRLTDDVTRLASADPKSDPRSGALKTSLTAFIRMYRPHEAREETVLFPALREIVAAKELDALGEQFEDREHRLFGERGFEGMVQRVAGIEKALGIEDLGKFTPRA